MDEDNSASEDEWTALKKRFSSEGLTWSSDEGSPQQILQVFRWLGDAEANLAASRNISDKLRNQHEEEKKEWEEYSDLLREKCETRVKELESETKALKQDLEALLGGTQAVASILLKEGLDDVANSSLGDQIAYLLVERQQLMEDLKAAEGGPSTGADGTERQDSISKLKSERNHLKEQNADLKDAMAKLEEKFYFLERSAKKLEDHNENLSFKLSEALLEIEEKERQLYYMDTSQEPSRYRRKDSISEPCSINYHRANRPLSSKGTPTRNPRSERRRSSDILNAEARSLNSVGDESPQRLNTFFESQISNSKTHLTQLSDVRRLQSEVQRLKMNYLKAGNKLEELQRLYDTLQLNSDSEKELMSKDQEREMEKLEKEMKELKNEVERSKKSTEAETRLRNKVEGDLQEVLKERREQIAKNREGERKQQEAQKEVVLMQKALKCSKEENAELRQRLRELAVAEIGVTQGT